MVEKAKAKGRGKKPSGTPRRRKGVKLRPTELGATELVLATLPAELEALAAAVRAGRRRGAGHLPRAAGRPRPAVDGAAGRQGRADAVPARHLRRARAAADAGDGQDQAVPGSDHRGARADRRRGLLDAQRLPPAHGAQGAGREDACSRCWCPERAVAYQILALNIEKAHNLREKAIGVRRMYVDLAPRLGRRRGVATRWSSRSRRWPRSGFAYEERGRLSGGAYHPILRKADRWLPGKLPPRAAEARARARPCCSTYDEAVTERWRR